MKQFVKKPIYKLIYILLILTFSTLAFTLNQSVNAQEATQSPAPDEKAAENIIEKIEQLVKDKSNKTNIRRAWVGNLESIANNTLTIDTKTGPKLASISAETSFVQLPKRNTIKAEDLELNTYAIAIGYLNGNQVLNVQRVVIDEAPPEYPKKSSQLITIDEIDIEAETISYLNNENQPVIVSLDKNTVISLLIDGQLTEASIEDIKPQTKAIAIIEFDKDDDEIEAKLLGAILIS